MKNKMIMPHTITIDFDPEDIDDLNKFVSLVRDKTAESFIKQTICEKFGVTPSKMTLDERLAFASEIENEKIMITSDLSIFNGEVNKTVNARSQDLTDLIKSAAVLEVLGFERLALQMRKKYGELFIENLLSSLRKQGDAEKTISEDRSRAKKGKRNIHYSEVMKIANDTWLKFPNASRAGLSAQIFAYLDKKYNGFVSVDTIKRWLKESGMEPTSGDKNKHFTLVICP